ncbi:MAG: hypothetical protein ABSH20_28590 [Tepidisphaeraceae bacterium]|jgi:hypothetical protein
MDDPLKPGTAGSTARPESDGVPGAGGAIWPAMPVWNDKVVPPMIDDHGSDVDHDADVIEARLDRDESGNAGQSIDAAAGDGEILATMANLANALAKPDGLTTSAIASSQHSPAAECRPADRNEARSLALDMTWAAAAGQPETSVELASLPEGVSFPADFPEPIFHDAGRRLLSYRGFMSASSYRFFKSLSSELSFTRAIDDLYVETTTATQPPSGWRSNPSLWMIVSVAVAAALTAWALWLRLRGRIGP